MMLGRYLPLDSFIHRLIQDFKIGSLLILLITIFFDAGFIGYAILGVFAMIMVILSKLKISQILRAMKPMLFMMAFLMFFNILFIQKETLLFSIGFIKSMIKPFIKPYIFLFV